MKKELDPEAVEAWCDETDQQLGQIEATLERLEEKIDQALERIDERLDVLENRIERLGVEDLERRIGNVEDDVSKLERAS